jgi:hypothetical protein
MTAQDAPSDIEANKMIQKPQPAYLEKAHSI